MPIRGLGLEVDTFLEAEGLRVLQRGQAAYGYLVPRPPGEMKPE